MTAKKQQNLSCEINTSIVSYIVVKVGHKRWDCDASVRCKV